MSTTVIHIRDAPANWETNDHYVYIGRPSKWGNPFRVSADDRNRADCIAQFRSYIADRPALIAAAKVELKGKILLCFCSPKKCHGEVLAEIADS